LFSQFIQKETLSKKLTQFFIVFYLADRMLRGHSRSRTVSLSSPTGYEHPPPHLGISGLYTEYLERRRKHSLSPPILSPPPPPLPLDRLIGGGVLPHHPPPPRRLCNGRAGGADPAAYAILYLLPPPALSSNNKRSAAEMSHELSR
jgi:hypothetical protein